MHFTFYFFTSYLLPFTNCSFLFSCYSKSLIYSILSRCIFATSYKLQHSLKFSFSNICLYHTKGTKGNGAPLQKTIDTFFEQVTMFLCSVKFLLLTPVCFLCNIKLLFFFFRHKIVFCATSIFFALFRILYHCHIFLLSHSSKNLIRCQK